MRTLLPVPDMAEAVGGLLGREVTPSELHDFIQSGQVVPFGRFGKAPVFTPWQVGEVALAVSGADPKSWGHQFRRCTEAARALRVDAQWLDGEVQAGRLPGVVIDGQTFVNTALVRRAMQEGGKS